MTKGIGTGAVTVLTDDATGLTDAAKVSDPVGRSGQVAQPDLAMSRKAGSAVPSQTTL